MEGFILAVSPNDKSAKKVWQTVFLKLDDISANLVAFTDRSQYCVQWSLPLVGADIATPIPGEPNHGVNVDDTPFCFYVRNSTGSSNKALARTSAGGDECHYLAAPSDEVKKQWMKLLLKNAKDGPRTPRFANMQAENEFSFQARVVKFRTHDGGKHAEYLITCSCQLFSKMAARRLAKQWDVWHRFSEFDTLNEALKVSLGAQLLGIDFVKHRRDALRSLFGSALEHNFLEERRLLLDTYITRVCDLNSPVEFFKHHADPNLKKFFCFDDHCQNVVSPTLMKYMLHLAASHSLECFAGLFRLQQDESPRKAPKGSRTKEQKTPRKSDKSERDEDSSRQSVSSSRATSDTNSQADFRYSESNSVGPAQKDSSAPKKHHHHEHSDKTKTEDGKSSDKRERQASKKKEKKNHLKGDALLPREDTNILRSASPTGAH